MAAHSQSPCHNFQAAHGAMFALSGDHSIVETFGDAEGEALALRDGAALFDLSHLGIIEIKGPDAKDFLHRLTTVHVKALQTGQATNGAILNPNGTTLSIFRFLNTGESYWILVAPEILKVTLEFLDKMHFGEKLEFKDQSANFGVISVQGPKSPEVLAKVGIQNLPENQFQITKIQIAGKKIGCTAISEYGSKGFYFLTATGDFSDVYKSLFNQERKVSLMPAGRLAAEWVRLEKGVPVYGIDVDASNIILEAGLDNFVHPNKGCYPGQEVVERIHTYGEVAKKLVRLEVQSHYPLKRGDKIFSGDKEVGFITSSARPPWREQAIALGYVRRGFNAEGNVLRADSDHAGPKGVAVVVHLLGSDPLP